MRYERRGMDVAPKAPRSRRQRKIMALGSVLVIAIAGVFFGLNVAHGPHRVVVIPGIAKAYLSANILIQNLGSPAPQGVTSPSWALTGDDLSDATTNPHLVQRERAWLGSSHAIIGLGSAAAAEILADQRQSANAVMTGELLKSTDTQLAQLVAGELRTRPQISSPGGGSIVSWYSISAHGNAATADATLEIWEQVDQFVDTPSGLRLKTSINQAEIEGKATLLRVGGTWKVASLYQLPYQQAT